MQLQLGQLRLCQRLEGGACSPCNPHTPASHAWAPEKRPGSRYMLAGVDVHVGEEAEARKQETR